MKTLVAFFDLLGFKEFLLNNEVEQINHVMNNILVRVESALSDQVLTRQNGKVVADLQNTVTHCANFSDSFVFWISDLNQDAIEDFFGVMYRFNWMMNTSIMPVRGGIVLGDINWIIGQRKNALQANYTVNMAYGKGIIDAYYLSEGQNWAGTIIEPKVFVELAKLGIDTNEIEGRFVEYDVPRKEYLKDEYRALRMSQDKTYPKKFADNIGNGIRRSFKIKKEENVPKSVLEKYHNTITFFNSFVE